MGTGRLRLRFDAGGGLWHDRGGAHSLLGPFAAVVLPAADPPPLGWASMLDGLSWPGGLGWRAGGAVVWWWR